MARNTASATADETWYHGEYMENQPLPPPEYDRILTIQLFENEAKEVLAAIDLALWEPIVGWGKPFLKSAQGKVRQALLIRGTE